MSKQQCLDSINEVQLEGVWTLNGGEGRELWCQQVDWKEDPKTKKLLRRAGHVINQLHQARQVLKSTT
jgi:hypothetical protein